MAGQELNGVYDGYTFLPFLLGHTAATSFQHLHNYEPHWKNHLVPHYGIFSNRYFHRMIKITQADDEKYSSFKKNHGPPYYSFSQSFMPLEHNDYLNSRGINASSLKQFAPKQQVS
jgi:hypothetical protein